MPRFQPKRWPAPKSWRTRNAGVVDVGVILKEFYPYHGDVEMRRPAWAYTAYDRHWMTSSEFYATKPEPTGRRSVLSMLYSSPSAGLLLRLLRKDTNYEKQGI